MSYAETYHVYHEADTKKHVLGKGGDCWCEPTVTYKDGDKYFLHSISAGSKITEDHREFLIKHLDRMIKFLNGK